MTCTRELVRFVCFCVFHNVSVYWCITSPKGLVGVGFEVGCGWSMRERFCRSHSIWSKLSAGWPSLASTHWCKSFISLISAVTLAWLLGINLLGWPSVSDPSKAMVVSESLVFSLSLSGPVFMPYALSMWRLMFLSTGCPLPLWWVALDVFYMQCDMLDIYLQFFWAGSWVVNAFTCCSCCGKLTCAGWFMWLIW